MRRRALSLKNVGHSFGQTIFTLHFIRVCRNAAPVQTPFARLALKPANPRNRTDPNPASRLPAEPAADRGRLPNLCCNRKSRPHAEVFISPADTSLLGWALFQNKIQLAGWTVWAGSVNAEMAICVVC